MNYCVVGLQWGDEGKGKVVDILAGDSDIVVRYGGGANAGHTVVVGDSRFALHLLPSGSVRPQTICSAQRLGEAGDDLRYHQWRSRRP